MKITTKQNGSKDTDELGYFVTANIHNRSDAPSAIGRLVEILAEKGILNAFDVLKIVRVTNDSDCAPVLIFD